MAKFRKCVLNAIKQLAQLSIDDIEKYVKDTLENAKKSGLSGKAAISNAKNATYNSSLNEIGSNAIIMSNSVAKFSKISKSIADNKFTTRDFLARGSRNIGNNVESAQLSNTNSLMDSFFNPITKDEVKFLQDKNNRLEIAEAVDGNNMSEVANRIGKAMNDYIITRNSKMILSDALSIDEIQSDRWLRSIHDRSRLINPASLKDRMVQFSKAPLRSIRRQSNFKANAKKQWIDFIKDKLDLDETFKKVDAFLPNGDIDHVKVDKILSNIYINITEGKTDIFQKTGILKDIESLKKRRRMFFHWKDFKNWSEYNEQYGTGDIFSALMSDIHGSSNKIGMSEIMGPAPEQMYEALKRFQENEGITRGSIWHKNTNNIFKWVSGESKIAVNMTAATIFSNIRAVTSMARLGGVALQSLTDTNIAASYATRFGVSYGQSFSNQITALLSQFTSPELKQLGEMMHLDMRHHMGYIGKFIEAQNLGNVSSKITSKYYQYVAMQAWDNGNRLGIMSTISRNFYKNKDISFKNLDQKLKSQLDNFNINSTEWDILRKKIKDKHLTLDIVDKISDEDYKKIRSSLGEDDSLLADIKNQLYRKIHTLFDVSSNNAVLSPGAYENAILLQGTKPGSVTGEIMRTIMQFKGFAVSFVNRSLADGWKNAGDGFVKKSLFMTQLFGYMMPLAYMSTYFFNLSKGLSTPSILDMTNEERAQLLASPFGVLAMGLDPNSQNSDLLADMLGGSPSARLASSLMSASGAALELNSKKAKSNLKRSLQYTLPISTVPWIQVYLKKAMGDKVYVPHGQHIIFGR
jgi:hypothetical protein